MCEQPEYPHQRPIRSFVIRGGRLTRGQKKAFERYWPQWGLELAKKPLDFSSIYGNEQPVWLEIGFGNGDSLVEMAAQCPHRNYLGIEVHPPGVGHCLMQIAKRNVTNVRIIQHDAREVIQTFIPTASLAGIQLFFPDPWHKKRHHKRRLVQKDFVQQIARILQPGGIFHAATDWEDYAQHMLETFSCFPALFANLSPNGDYVPRPQDRPLTKFEKRGQRLGHAVWDLMFKRT